MSLVPALEVSSTSTSTSSAGGCGTRAICSSGPISSGSAARAASTCRGPLRGCCPPSSGATGWRQKAKRKGGPGRPETTSSWPPARATCRPTRCRWRSHMRCSATAARSSLRTSGSEIHDAAGRVLREFDLPPRRHAQIDPEYRAVILEGLHDAAQSPRGTSYRSSAASRCRSPARPGPRTIRPHEDQSWHAVLAPYPNPEIVTDRDRRGRWLRRRIGGSGGRGNPRPVFPRAPVRQGRRRRREGPDELRDARPPRPSRALLGAARDRRSGSAFLLWMGPSPSPRRRSPPSAYLR